MKFRQSKTFLFLDILLLLFHFICCTIYIYRKIKNVPNVSISIMSTVAQDIPEGIYNNFKEKHPSVVDLYFSGFVDENLEWKEAI